MSVSHDISSCSETRHLLYYQGWTRQPRRRKGSPKQVAPALTVRNSRKRPTKLHYSERSTQQYHLGVATGAYVSVWYLDWGLGQACALLVLVGSQRAA